MSRSDLSGEPAGPDSYGIHHLSAVTGDGLAALADRLVEEAGRLVGHGEILSLANDRQRRVVSDCHAALLEAAAAAHDPVLVAEHLRAALNALGRLTGRVGVEAMLDALLGRFCIGKSGADVRLPITRLCRPYGRRVGKGWCSKCRSRWWRYD